MRCANPGPCSSQPQGHKTAFKFHRIRCTKCLTSPDNHQKEEYHTCKTWACLIQFHVVLPDVAVKMLQNKRFLNVRYGFSLQRMQFTKDLKGQPERQDISEKVQNRKASCCTLRKRITKLKCVNSEFKTVNTHPEKGCLKWLHGTMSEPPWKSH